MNFLLKGIPLLLVFLASGTVVADQFTLGMMALDDSDMATVTGREGIALDLELRINADSNGAPLASMGGCSGTGNGCILALQFANRLAGGGEWLVLKGYYGVMRLNDIRLDGSRLPAVASPFANPDRFKDQNGNCLVASCDPSGSLAAIFTYPDNPGFTADVELALNIGRTSVQFGAEGYLPSADNGASFLGLRIGDTQTGVGRIDINGGLQLYGF
ncbi:MAG: hypothetical protein V2I38_07160 [Alcanivoracaceae bacterium]|jgi:hypothetical protein|nr:hypothetical protein [Alcanivoracaceae bacterium]